MDGLGLEVEADFEEPESDEDVEDVEEDSLLAAGTVDDEPARLSVR